MDSVIQALITGDGFRAHDRTEVNRGRINVEILASLVGPPLRRSGAAVTVIAGYLGNDRARCAFERRLGSLGDAFTWAQRSQVLAPSISRFYDELTDGYDLVVGFELAPSMVEYCAGRGLAAIDLTFHPVRFLDDLVLAARAVPARLDAAIRQIELDFSALSLVPATRRPDREKARRQFNALVPPSRAEPSEIFFVQTRFDRSKFDGRGGFVDEIALIEESGIRPAFYKKHPVEPRTEIEFLLRRMGARPLDGTVDAYTVLCALSDRVAVSAISSSILAEARTIGVAEVRALFGYPWRMRGLEHLATPFARDDPFEYVAVDRRLLTDGFWSAIVEGRDPPANAPPGLDRDRLRSAWENPWGGGPQRV